MKKFFICATVANLTAAWHVHTLFLPPQIVN